MKNDCIPFVLELRLAVAGVDSSDMPAIGRMPLLKRIDIAVPKLEDDLNSLVLQVLNKVVKIGNLPALQTLCLVTTAEITSAFSYTEQKSLRKLRTLGIVVHLIDCDLKSL